MTGIAITIFVAAASLFLLILLEYSRRVHKVSQYRALVNEYLKNRLNEVLSSHSNSDIRNSLSHLWKNRYLISDPVPTGYKYASIFFAASAGLALLAILPDTAGWRVTTFLLTSLAITGIVIGVIWATSDVLYYMWLDKVERETLKG